jgi:hypothetical protein
MNKYTLKQATEIIRGKINYNISDSSMNLYKRLGIFKPYAKEHVPYMNRTIFVYTDESIQDFVNWYLEEARQGKIKRFAKSVIDSQKDIEMGLKSR